MEFNGSNIHVIVINQKLPTPVKFKGYQVTTPEVLFLWGIIEDFDNQQHSSNKSKKICIVEAERPRHLKMHFWVSPSWINPLLIPNTYIYKFASSSDMRSV
jgi:hypothetical protein